jgi:hypothetical protein
MNKKPICKKADTQKADMTKSRATINKKPIYKKPICQKADIQKADMTKSRFSEP